MPAPAQPSVINVTEAVRFLPGAQATRVTVVTFMVGNDGPFTIEVPADQDTVQFVATALANKAKELAIIRGVSQ